MENEILRSKLQELHVTILSRQMDSKTLNYWTHMIDTGSKSVREFEQMLINSPEYKELVRKKFRESFFDLIGFDISEADYNACHEHFASKLVSDTDVFEYVAHLPMFDEKYTGLVKNIYELVYEDVCPEEVVTFYLNTFKTNPSYTIDQLTADIKNKVHASEMASDDEKYIQFAKEIEVLFGTLPQDVKDFQKIAVTPVSTNCSPCSLNAKLIQEFEDVFKRPMYVQEYFKYASLNDPDFGGIYQNHQEQYNRLNELYQSYTWDGISEYDYVKMYLNKVDEPTFFDTILDTIIESKEYEECLSMVIKQRYKALYDEDLEQNDIKYIFGIVQEEKISRSDDRLPVVITDIKKETDEIIAQIFEQYFIVLERQPDVYEIEQHVEFYRTYIRDAIAENKSWDMDVINSQLEKHLMASLEFHEILKKKIKYLYKQAKGKDALPSIVYNVLQKCIPMLPKSRMTSIDDVINGCF